MQTVLRVLVSLALFLFAAAAPAQQRTYPSRPIRVIVPQAPGGTTDIAARMFSAWLEQRWKEPTVVENRPGAGAIIGSEFVAKSPPDGYTLLINSQQVAFMQLQFKNLRFDPVKDLTPLGILVGSGYVFVIPASLPVKNVAEFVAYAKANPGKLNWAHPGEPLPEHVELFQALGIDKELTPIMYKGGSPAVQAVVSGEAHLYSGGPSQAFTLVKEGRVKALFYTGLQRHPMLPDVPTVSETVLPGYDAKYLMALYAPAAIPGDIAQRLNAEVLEMTRAPQNRERLLGMGYQLFPLDIEGTRKEFAAVTKRMEGLAARGLLKQAD